MKEEVTNPENILAHLEDLELLSEFIIYEKFGYNEKKLKKGLKKMIKKIKKGELEKCIDKEFYGDG